MSRAIIYVLTNRAMPGWVKIGRTAPENLTQRITSLSGTSVPFPFECAYAALVDDGITTEARLHRVLGSVRHNPRREFFEMPVETAIDALMLLHHENVTPGGDFAADASDQALLDDDRVVEIKSGSIDCIVVISNDRKFDTALPTKNLSFEALFVAERRWYEFRMSEPYRNSIKWVAAYRTAPLQVVSHLALVEKFEVSPTGKVGYWQAVFDSPPEKLERPVPLGTEAVNGLMQGPRYCNKDKLISAPSLAMLFDRKGA